VCCRLYPFILLDNKKEGPGNFSGGCSPHWVNHVYLCLYYLYIFYVLFPYLFYFIARDPFFLTTGIKEKGNSQEKRVVGSSGSNGTGWKG
jgi:hypothetical protein